MLPWLLIWGLAELHTLFVAFAVVGPLVVVVVELVGAPDEGSGRPRERDAAARELCRILPTALALTAALGAGLVLGGRALYPELATYLVDVFRTSMYLYGATFVGLALCLLVYDRGWGRLGRRTHLILGGVLGCLALVLVLVESAWTSFVIAPAGVDLQSGELVSRHGAFFGVLLWPLTIQRVVVSLGMAASTAAAYAAGRLLTTTDPAARAHYDWMGHVALIIALCALVPLPLVDHYLGHEVYAHSPQLGAYMSGGALSWVTVLQAIVTGVLLCAANYALWLHVGRSDFRKRPWARPGPWLILIGTCAVVWATPASGPLRPEPESSAGGFFDVVLWTFGQPEAEAAAIGLVILATVVAMELGRRATGIMWGRTSP